MFKLKEKTKPQLPADNCLRELEHGLEEPTEEAKKALEMVNIIREGLGWEHISNLPKGKISDPSDCPVYHALNGIADIKGDTLSFHMGKINTDQFYNICRILSEHGFKVVNSGASDKREEAGASPIGVFVREMDEGNQPQYIK